MPTHSAQRSTPPSTPTDPTKDQDDELLALGQGAAVAGPEPVAVHEEIAHRSRRHPDRAAVTGADLDLGYGSLDAWARRIAARLAADGVGPGARIAVLATPSAAMIAAVLGVLRSGAALVPIDPSHPDRRVAELLADADVAAAVTAAGARCRCAPSGMPVLAAEDTAAEDTAAADTLAVAGAIGAATDRPAYLIYTSGSTGEPKGVVVEHRHLAASTRARRLAYPGNPVFLLVSPLAFDSAMAGIFGTLTAGGHLVVATADEVRDPERLVLMIEQHRVTQILCIPSLYAVLLDAAERLGADRLRTLRTVIVAGEPLAPAIVERHFAVLREPVELVNEYGPTEATVWATSHHLTAPGTVSIGRPIPGVLLYVLDDRLRLVPRGAEGELFIGGPQVARGYFGRPEATARAFLADPFAGPEDARMYRTGDIVRWNDDGTLHFVGRRDHQVKIRGHRVELGSVEAVLCSVTGVREAVVVPDRDLTGLVGFVVADGDLDPDVLRTEVAERLPSVMVPDQIAVLDTFPRTITGKADRAGLAVRARDLMPTRSTTDTTRATADPGRAETRGDLTADVSAAWSEVLTVPDIPTEVNFFDLGGHSLAMFALQDALQRHTGHRPSVVALFRHTTVSAQVELLRGGAAEDERARLDPQRAAAQRARVLAARSRPREGAR